MIGLSGRTGESTWLLNHITKNDASSVDELTELQVYKNSLYLCTVVLTSVGFGDIVPTSGFEEVCMIGTMFFTGITWAWVVANVVAVITGMDVFGSIFNQTMDELNFLLADHNVDNSLKLRIRKHVHESYKLQRERHHHEAISWLSAGLQGELAMQSGVNAVCQRIWYLNGLPEEVIIELADEFQGALYSPSEIIMDHDSVSVIMRGACIKK
eukprot:CAMPEP_0169296342 /NCGR_PEP_ID=MMETSP1016-20121227/65097_1 /TAXON_ID=342587 /ORGANISM="Karlodinium micrum, Strain CCMP2283" /LENGTH=211 /DNA_ID=CAMNT_0009387743 /DNA_START=91 /DNA_END=723 /DNA_ORIENTATION=-